jgi:hypothetical protein
MSSAISFDSGALIYIYFFCNPHIRRVLILLVWNRVPTMPTDVKSDSSSTGIYFSGNPGGIYRAPAFSLFLDFSSFTFGLTLIRILLVLQNVTSNNLIYEVFCMYIFSFWSPVVFICLYDKFKQYCVFKNCSC